MEKKRSIFFDTSLIYFLVIVCFIGIRIFSNLVSISEPVSAVLNVIIQVGLMLALPFFMYKFLRKKKTSEVFKEFNVKPINTKAILLSVLIGILVYFLTLAVASFFNIIIYGVGYDPSFGMASTSSDSYPLVQFLLDIVVTAILPGICEEFCHRGLLVNGYKQLNIKKTILLVGILFGLMHLNIEQFFYASVIGMFLTFLVYVSGSIIPAMIIHFMNNFLGLYFTFASYNNLPFGDFATNLANALQTSNAFLAFMAIIFVVIIFLALLAFLVFMLMKQTRVKQFELLAKKAIAKKERERLFAQFNLDANKIDAENGEKPDENMPEVVFKEDISRAGSRGVIVDVNFKNSILEGEYFIKKPSLKDKMFLYGALFLGIFVTLSTLIWGII
ncbi:MAG: CPBP family intramembrane metalloprotease [Clostridiales bacterium]|nr:CPBP family intramembrane metalloprotease [Clostridiales bacterium]